jgi:hypothetical protein
MRQHYYRGLGKELDPATGNELGLLAWAIVSAVGLAALVAAARSWSTPPGTCWWPGW